MSDVAPVRRSGPVGVAVSLCVAAALLFVAGCDQVAASDPVTVGGSSAPPSEGPATGGATGSPSPRQPDPSPAAVLPDGRSAAILTKVDLRAGTLTFDLVVVLTGDAMNKYLKAHPEAADPYYSPAYIVINDNSKLRTIPLASTATVKVINLDSGNNATHSISLADLPAHLKTSGYHEQDGSSAFPYYLTVLHGQVTALQELGVA
jgi:hypothetical protein